MARASRSCYTQATGRVNSTTKTEPRARGVTPARGHVGGLAPWQIHTPEPVCSERASRLHSYASESSKLPKLQIPGPDTNHLPATEEQGSQREKLQSLNLGTLGRENGPSRSHKEQTRHTCRVRAGTCMTPAQPATHSPSAWPQEPLQVHAAQQGEGTRGSCGPRNLRPPLPTCESLAQRPNEHARAPGPGRSHPPGRHTSIVALHNL